MEKCGKMARMMKAPVAVPTATTLRGIKCAVVTRSG